MVEEEDIRVINLKTYLNTICDKDCKEYLDLSEVKEKCLRVKTAARCSKEVDEFDRCEYLQ